MLKYFNVNFYSIQAYDIKYVEYKEEQLSAILFQIFNGHRKHQFVLFLFWGMLLLWYEYAYVSLSLYSMCCVCLSLSFSLSAHVCLCQMNVLLSCLHKNKASVLLSTDSARSLEPEELKNPKAQHQWTVSFSDALQIWMDVQIKKCIHG